MSISTLPHLPPLPKSPATAIEYALTVVFVVIASLGAFQLIGHV